MFCDKNTLGEMTWGKGKGFVGAQLKVQPVMMKVKAAEMKARAVSPGCSRLPGSQPGNGGEPSHHGQDNLPTPARPSDCSSQTVTSRASLNQ